MKTNPSAELLNQDLQYHSFKSFDNNHFKTISIYQFCIVSELSGNEIPTKYPRNEVPTKYCGNEVPINRQSVRLQ